MQIDISSIDCYVAVVSHDGKNVIEFTAGLAKAAQAGLQFDMGLLKGNSIVQHARNVAAHGFLNDCQAQKMIFIDTDIGFQGEDLLRLVATSTRYPIVCGMYPTKDSPVRFAANPEVKDGKLIQDKYGMVRLHSGPLGFSVIDRSVFQAMSDFPKYKKKKDLLTEFFRVYVHEEELIGEDMDFCEQAYNKGFELWCDPQIKLKHIGDKDYEGDFVKSLLDSGYNF